MNFTYLAIVSIILTLSFYIAFLVLGIGGIAKNRRAQGLEEKPNKK
tara:strand:- start:200 stop:337 length:138 start_codon:yes stop_codon:yes gene_type:complete